MSIPTIPNYYPQAHYITPSASSTAAIPGLTGAVAPVPVPTLATASTTLSSTHYTPSPSAAQYLAQYASLRAGTPTSAGGSYSFPSTTYNASSYGLGIPVVNGIPGVTTAMGVGTHKSPTGTIRPSSPVASAVTSREASQSIQRLAAGELRNAGFDGAMPEALYVIEQEVVGSFLPTQVVQSLYTLAHSYSNLANRSGPIATDLLLAAEDFEKDWAYDVGPKTLANWIRKRKRKQMKGKDIKGKAKAKPSLPLTVVPHPPRSPTPELLHSDDEIEMEDPVPTPTAPVQQQKSHYPNHQINHIPPTAHPTHLSLAPPSLTSHNQIQASGPAVTTTTKLRTIPTSTLRNLPGNLPGLPPKHTYLQTPAAPRRTLSQNSSSSSSNSNTTPKSQNQLQMEKKLRTAALVQESLKNLLLATEYSEEDDMDIDSSANGVNGTGGSGSGSGGVAATAKQNAELLGHIVNWESTIGLGVGGGGGGRKRWRV
ncbi:hypothetical protein F5876DRAFT_74381 [Lentinula aff. lateritia]|uniref:Uncharacterized protein n=1 Tax=Lentinula aff. lateritia TaxID=2804960 RepID=A0ACC1U765_9AGAR|nr:hypothetical protein F5876DRAFT_74381 [Lentinula aff. lateritia]